MKKKILITIGAIFVLAALIISLIFVFWDRDVKKQTETPDLTGTWAVVANYENDIPVFIEKQFMVFEEDNASLYKDGEETAYATSSFTINEANQLILSDISREYKIDRKTDNCVRLYETATKYMLLVRNGSSELQLSTFEIDALTGKWDVLMKGDQTNNGEILEFNGNSINYYKDASAEPFATASFTLSDDKTIHAESLNLKMKCYYISDDTFLLLEDSGIVWEISKVQ